MNRNASYLALTVVLALTACGGPNAGSSSGAPVVPSSATRHVLDQIGGGPPMYMTARLSATSATLQACVTGTVVDGSGAPIPQATVVVSDSSRSVVGSASTAADGTFSIALPQLGSYTVVVGNGPAISVSVSSSGVTNLGSLRG